MEGGEKGKEGEKVKKRALSNVSPFLPLHPKHFAVLLARYAELCARDGLEPGAARPPAEAPEPGDLDELRQLEILIGARSAS